jgi:inosose dehydratase
MKQRVFMAQFHFGNAPCSWGMLEFESTRQSEPIGFAQVLDEIAETKYTGTELGDWGFMPTEPQALRAELDRRRLSILGAFVPVALKDASAHSAGIDDAVKTARLLSSVATEAKPYLVLADANGTVPERTRAAGRITADLGLTPSQWKTFASGANAVASAVLAETGLRTVFHHHCAGYVETPQEISTFLELTDPALVGLVFDTGHFIYGTGAEGADMTAFLDSCAERIWYAHAKDCSAEVALTARAQKWDYFKALQHGVFCELGKGCVDFAAFLGWLQKRKYDGYIVVEQDVLPGLGSPKESARRNRDYLHHIESTLS